MTSDHTHDLLPTACPYCAKKLDAASHVDLTDVRPRPGDTTICFYCAGLMVFADDGRPRKPTDDEALEMENNPEVLNARVLVRRSIAVRKERS
jgi:hypothetical protein